MPPDEREALLQPAQLEVQFLHRSFVLSFSLFQLPMVPQVRGALIWALDRRATRAYTHV
jgi:hypothetical protein